MITASIGHRVRSFLKICEKNNPLWEGFDEIFVNRMNGG
jgi:hypothetical protein